jgi:hypothetical protein
MRMSIKEFNDKVEYAMGFIEDFEFDKPIFDSLEPHKDVLETLANTTMLTSQFDYDMAFTLVESLIKISYQLGYKSGVNSVVYGNDENGED